MNVRLVILGILPLRRDDSEENESSKLYGSQRPPVLLSVWFSIVVVVPRVVVVVGPFDFDFDFDFAAASVSFLKS